MLAAENNREFLGEVLSSVEYKQNIIIKIARLQ